MVNIKIEGVSYQVEEGLTILEAAKSVATKFPLCAHLTMASATTAPAVFVWLKW